MNSNTVFMFPGQGSQSVGMQACLEPYPTIARPLFDEADEVLGFPLRELIEKGPSDTLTRTSNAQPALLAMGVAMGRVLESKGFQAQIAMGHSLGEYAALVYAHVLSFRDALRLVRVRGELMDRAAEKTPGTMAAVKGVSREALYKIVDEMNQFGVVEITNVNGPSQLTVSGEPSAVEHLIATIRSTRIGRAIQLRVSAPFHSSLMKPISDEFAKYLADTEFRSPKIPVITNVTAMEQGDPSAIRAQLVAQLYSPVLWESSAIRAFELGGRYFVESGPGNVLSGLVRGTLADVTAITGEQALLGA